MKLLQDILQNLAKYCIILAEISQYFRGIALFLQVSFKILLCPTRFLQEPRMALSSQCFFIAQNLSDTFQNFPVQKSVRIKQSIRNQAFRVGSENDINDLNRKDRIR